MFPVFGRVRGRQLAALAAGAASGTRAGLPVSTASFKCSQSRGQVERWRLAAFSEDQPPEVRTTLYEAKRPGIVIDVGMFDHAVL
jgi:hypothetical protein